ncbi:CU044_5270 family protein [Micromonospora sp. NPDC003197]
MNRQKSTDPDDSGLRLLAGLREGQTGASPDARDRMRHAVLNGTLHRDATARPVAVVRGRRPLVHLAATLALTGLAGGVVVVTGVLDLGDARPAATSPGGGSNNSRIGPDTSAVLVLELVAQQAALAPAVAIRSGQYVYLRTESSNTGSYSGGPWGSMAEVRLRYEGWSESWLDPQGMYLVKLRGEHTTVRPLTPQDRAIAEQAGLLKGQPERYERANKEYAAGKAELKAKGPSLAERRLTSEYLASLPTNPDELLAVLRSAATSRAEKDPAGEPSVDAYAFGLVADLFQNYDPIIPPQLKAALYRAVAKLPGIERVEGEVKLGAYSGIALTYPMKGKERTEIVLDPVSFRFVGTRSNVGQVDETWTRVIESRPVDAVGKA